MGSVVVSLGQAHNRVTDEFFWHLQEQFLHYQLHRHHQDSGSECLSLDDLLGKKLYGLVSRIPSESFFAGGDMYST